MALRPRASVGAALIALALASPGFAARPGRAPEAAPTPVGDPVRGEVLAGLGGCAACHTADNGPALAGGHRIETSFGVFVGPNLTPSIDGLAGWTFEDFVRAMRDGRDPAGRAYWPAFPYASFRGMTDQDLADLWAWLGTFAPVDRPDAPHELRPFYGTRAALGLWRSFALPRTPRGAGPDADPMLVRGAYLVDTLGHCGECHTPRDGIGAPRMGRYLGGSDEPPAGGPNLTPAPGALGGWTLAEVEEALSSGMTPEGDFLGGEMGRVVREGTARLSPEDRRAMAAWLLAQRPVRQPERRPTDAADDPEADAWD